MDIIRSTLYGVRSTEHESYFRSDKMSKMSKIRKLCKICRVQWRLGTPFRYSVERELKLGRLDILLGPPKLPRN